MRLQISTCWILLGIAIPIWFFVIMEVGSSPGWGADPIGFVLAPLVLAGISVTLHYPLRRLRNAWPVSAVAAPILTLVGLLLVAWCFDMNESFRLRRSVQVQGIVFTLLFLAAWLANTVAAQLDVRQRPGHAGALSRGTDGFGLWRDDVDWRVYAGGL